MHGGLFFPLVVRGKWKIIISLGEKNRPFSFRVFIFYLFFSRTRYVAQEKNTMFKKLFYENFSSSWITYSSVLLFRRARKTWLFIHNKITSNDYSLSCLRGVNSTIISNTEPNGIFIVSRFISNQFRWQDKFPSRLLW